MAATVEGSFECRAVSSADRLPGHLDEVFGNQVVGKTEMGLGTAVVDIVSYPVEVAEGLDDIGAVATGMLHSGTLVGVQTLLTGAEAVFVELMAHARLIKVHHMVALAAGIFHEGVFAVSSHHGATLQRMGEFLDELAVAAVNHVIVIVDWQLLLAKALVLRINDIVTHQTPLVVVSPVSRIGSKFMLLPNLLSAILTFLVVY